jgi:hypothetical protein
MTPQEEINLVKKVLDLNKEAWSIKSVYFNPSFADDLLNRAQLASFGFSSEVNEVESESGDVVKSALISPTKEKLELGSILMDGKDIVIQEDLRTFEDIQAFLTTNIQQVASQQVTLNSN